MLWSYNHDCCLHDAENVKGFTGDYRWLSNFYPCTIKYKGLTYRSSEAAYQAAKCLYESDKQQFTKVDSSMAKKLGRRITMRSNWESEKLAVMHDILVIKFQDLYLRNKLKATGSKSLEETNWWGDRFWGVCEREGENHLGKILTGIRAAINQSNK